jgi:acyl carrier protein
VSIGVKPFLRPTDIIALPMQSEEIYSQLTEIFHDLFDDDNIVLTPQLTAAEVPEWDSFNHINLIVAVESRFKIKFQTAELEQLNTIGHLADLIAAKLAAQGR